MTSPDDLRQSAFESGAARALAIERQRIRKVIDDPAGICVARERW